MYSPEQLEETFGEEGAMPQFRSGFHRFHRA